MLFTFRHRRGPFSKQMTLIVDLDLLKVDGIRLVTSGADAEHPWDIFHENWTCTI